MCAAIALPRLVCSAWSAGSHPSASFVIGFVAPPQLAHIESGRVRVADPGGNRHDRILPPLLLLRFRKPGWIDDRSSSEFDLSTDRRVLIVSSAASIIALLRIPRACRRPRTEATLARVAGPASAPEATMQRWRLPGSIRTFADPR